MPQNNYFYHLNLINQIKKYNLFARSTKLILMVFLANVFFGCSDQKSNNLYSYDDNRQKDLYQNSEIFTKIVSDNLFFQIVPSYNLANQANQADKISDDSSNDNELVNSNPNLQYIFRLCSYDEDPSRVSKCINPFMSKDLKELSISQTQLENLNKISSQRVLEYHDYLKTKYNPEKQYRARANTFLGFFLVISGTLTSIYLSGIAFAQPLVLGLVIGAVSLLMFSSSLIVGFTNIAKDLSTPVNKVDKEQKAQLEKLLNAELSNAKNLGYIDETANLSYDMKNKSNLINSLPFITSSMIKISKNFFYDSKLIDFISDTAEFLISNQIIKKEEIYYLWGANTCCKDNQFNKYPSNADIYSLKLISK